MNPQSRALQVQQERGVAQEHLERLEIEKQDQNVHRYTAENTDNGVRQCLEQIQHEQNCPAQTHEAQYGFLLI